MTNLIHQIESHLARERAVILAGEFDKLGDLAHEKTALFTRFHPDLDKAGVLKSAVQKNLELLDTARRGIRDMQDQFRMKKQQSTNSSTYNQCGEIKNIGINVCKIKKNY